MQEYVRREPEAVTLVHELLAEAGASIDAFMADALAEKLEYIERIDRLATIAEGRRNDALNEIEPRGRSSAYHCDRPCERLGI